MFFALRFIRYANILVAFFFALFAHNVVYAHRVFLAVRTQNAFRIFIVEYASFPFQFVYANYAKFFFGFDIIQSATRTLFVLQGRSPTLTSTLCRTKDICYTAIAGAIVLPQECALHRSV